MDMSKYITKCLRCGTEIETDWYAIKGSKAFGGVTVVSGVLIGATWIAYASH
jgi:hypothetical protein